MVTQAFFSPPSFCCQKLLQVPTTNYLEIQAGNFQDNLLCRFGRSFNFFSLRQQMLMLMLQWAAHVILGIIFSGVFLRSVNGKLVVWGPVVWISGIPPVKGIVSWGNPKAPGPKPPIYLDLTDLIAGEWWTVEWSHVGFQTSNKNAPIISQTTAGPSQEIYVYIYRTIYNTWYIYDLYSIFIIYIYLIYNIYYSIYIFKIYANFALFNSFEYSRAFRTPSLKLACLRRRHHTWCWVGWHPTAQECTLGPGRCVLGTSWKGLSVFVWWKKSRTTWGTDIPGPNGNMASNGTSLRHVSWMKCATSRRPRGPWDVFVIQIRAFGKACFKKSQEMTDVFS